MTNPDSLAVDICCSGVRRLSMGDRPRVAFDPRFVPEQGDVVVARVISIGQHDRIEIVGGQEALLRIGQPCALVLARRYATWEFHGQIPPYLEPGSELHLLNTGGASGLVTEKNQMTMDPTLLEFVAYVTDPSGQKENLKYHSVSPAWEGEHLPTVVLIVGADMESGKTTAASCAIRTLVRAGYKTGGAKLTGTTRMKDLVVMGNAGADPTLDFVDFGLPSTYGSSDETVSEIFDGMRAVSAEQDCQFVVIEVADGVLQPETHAVLTNASIMKQVALLVFAAADSMAVHGGCGFLSRLGRPPDLAAGLFTTSPSRIREVRLQCSIPVLCDDERCREEFLELAKRARTHGTKR